MRLDAAALGWWLLPVVACGSRSAPASGPDDASDTVAADAALSDVVAPDAAATDAPFEVQAGAIDGGADLCSSVVDDGGCGPDLGSRCGTAGMACCPPNSCADADTTCVPEPGLPVGVCRKCGNPGEPCCGGTRCAAGFTCRGFFPSTFCR